MSALTIPADLASELRDALRWAGHTDAATELHDLVAAGVPWRLGRVRELIAWAERRRVCVGADSERFLVTVNAGFGGDGWGERMFVAKAVLRLAADNVASGLEAPGLIGEGLIALDEPRSFNWDSWQGDPWAIDTGTGATRYPSVLDMGLTPPTSAASPAPAAAPSRPSHPRGGWVQRA